MASGQELPLVHDGHDRLCCMHLYTRLPLPFLGSLPASSSRSRSRSTHQFSPAKTMADFLLQLICPDSPFAWRGNQFSNCFRDLVLDFGVNFVTVLLLILVGLAQKNSDGRWRIKSSWKLFLRFLPAIGACLSLLDIFLLLKKSITGDFVAYHEWLSRCSQFVVWTSLLLFSTSSNFHRVFTTPYICFWWIIKALFGSIILLTTFSSLKVLESVKESCIVTLDIVFALSINIIRLKWESSGRSSMAHPLLSADMDVEEGQCRDFELRHKCWDLMTFNTITPVMHRGVTKQLDFEDLIDLPTDMDPASCHEILSSCWQDQKSSDDYKPSLFRAICSAYGWPYARLGLLKMLNDSIGFTGPLLLNLLIKYLQQGSRNFDGYVFAVSLGLTSVLKSLLDTQYTFHLSKIKLKLRSGIVTIIYQKCLSVNLAERSKFSEGEIQTFMSVDTDRTVNMCNSFHDMWSLPFQIGIALYLLYMQVKFAFISGIAITILLIPVNKWISELIANATEKMMKQKDERIRRTGEILMYIRTLKMYGWEFLFFGWLMKTRSAEVTHLTTRKYLDAWCVFFWATTPTLFSLFTFGLFELMGYQLDAATVFTCVALFNSLISPLNSFPWVINGMIDAIISIKRLSRFLSCSENKPQHLTKADAASHFLEEQSVFAFHDMAVVASNACCSWSSSEEGEGNMLLRNVTLHVPQGSFVAIIGEVGSGKSSMLNAILREMKLISGAIWANGSTAYVPQVPWILSGTIRDNILFGKDYDPQRYSDTLHACALNFDISSMLGGEMAHISERGVNLSGGQRARLALARAIYHESDIIILDDVLSAVDPQVAQWLLHNALLGPIVQQQTRILCTHNHQAISSADVIVVMEKGQVKWVGKSDDLSIPFYPLLFPLNEVDTSMQTDERGGRITTSTEEKQTILEETDAISVKKGALEIEEVELRKEGRVELSVYKNYASFCGWFVAAVICLSATLMQASRNGNDLWLSYWVDTTTRSTQEDNSTSFYLVILCIFCVINSVLTLVRAFSFAFGGLQAAIKVHHTLFHKLICAPVQFFDQTPSGRILNRFSSDLYTIDDSLPFILNILLANFFGLMGIVLVLSYVQVFFLVLLLPFWWIYSRLQSFYRSTSRELRRLDSVSRSPIYAAFTETLDGSTTIRAFKSEGFFFSQFTKYVTSYQQTSYTELTASLWLSLRLQLLAAVIISFVGLMAVIGSNGNFPISFGTPGLVGLALSYAAPTVSLLGNFLTSFTETEKEMVSMERALQYMDVPQEELHGTRALDSEWPYHGLIEFKNVTLRYKPSLPAALRDVSFTILGGTQVGIIGRTGAGKSSILNAFFRLTPITTGCILVDRINIAEFPVRDIRQHFGVVPQIPFLFEGSLRDNLDPYRASEDFKIWNILEKCYMKEEVESVGGLETLVKESGLSFSVGQRQLLCLARALLKSSKVLCLDECTANVDSQTAELLQNVISSECRGTTVVTIAHRISTVLEIDNVLILDHGILVEEGSPQDLRQNPSSKFAAFLKASRT